MMRALISLVLFACMAPAQAAINWSGLWRNPDQQGEALLQQGDAAAAARVYTDARRKAYAELKAGDYTAAARDLSAFDDSDAHYNRGNALAYAGDLQGAIKAYDAALKRDPHNQDASHNRELVENALKQPPPKQQDAGSGKSKDGKPDEQNGNSRNSPAQGQGKQDKQPGQDGSSGQQGSAPSNKQAQPGDNPGKQGNASAPGNAQQQGAAPGKSNDGNQSANAGGASGKQPSAANTQSAAAGDKAGSSQNSSAPGTPGNQAMQQGSKADPGSGQPAAQTPGRDDAEQARQDAAASLEYAAPDKQDGKGSGDQAGANGVRQSTPPVSEKQLAQEQWLRSIPDDPGGLLRRKFMIEHMMRQQKAQP